MAYEKKYNFIRTSDPETKEKLLKLGYTIISVEGDLATFYNDLTKVSFESNDGLQYTNMLNI